jgi:hypothetical protein
MADIEAAQAIDTKTMASFRIEREDWQAFGALAKKERLTVTQVLTDYIERCLAIGKSMYGVSINPDAVDSSLDPLPINGNLHSAIDGRLTAIEQRLDMPSINAEYMATELARFARRLEAIEQRPPLTEDQVTTICELTMQGWPPITEDRVRELVRAEVERLGDESATNIPMTTTPPQTEDTAKSEMEHLVKVSPTAADSETMKMVRRFEADPAFRAAAAKAIAQGGSNSEISQRLLDAGHSNSKGTAHDPSAITRMKKALTHMNGEGG